MKILIVLLTLSIFASCRSFINKNVKKNNKRKPIIAVYPTWSVNSLAVENIPWNSFSHIAIPFILPNPDGSIYTNEVDKIIPEIVAEAHKRTKKVYVSIGGATGYQLDSFQIIASDDKILETFVKNINEYVSKYSIDGIDIDWEFWTKQDIDRVGGNDPVESKLLVKLLSELRSSLPKSVDLTVDVFAGSWKGEQYLKEIQNYVTYVVLMSYDFTGAWPQSEIKHHSDYETFKASINFFIDRGFDKKKMIVGTPFYGIQFHDGKNEKISHIPYKDILNNGNIENTFYETPSLIRKKSEYIVKNDLAGIMFFELTQDEINSPYSLLKASNEVIKTY